MKDVKIIRVLDQVNMGLGHDGLALLLKRRFSYDVAEMKPDSLVVCINRAKDRVKILGSKGLVVGYLKLPRGQRLMMEAIQYIPQAFGADGFNYDTALTKALAHSLTATGARKPGPYTAFER